MSFTVTATGSGSTALGLSVDVVVLTGQDPSSPIGASSSVDSTTPAGTVTPSATGSKVYAAILGLTGTFTVNGVSTQRVQRNAAGLNFAEVRLTSTTTSGTPVTVGGTSTANSISNCVAEIKQGSGLTLAEDASSPGEAYNGTGTETTSTVAFTPPAGSLLLALVIGNGAASVVNMAMSDSSGLGLTWTLIKQQHTAGKGYSGLWYAVMPGANVNANGVVANLALSSPAGSVTADANASGVAANLALSAPAGSVTSDAKANGVVANLALNSPTGSVTSDANASGVVANLALSSPAGSVTSDAVIHGVSANLDLTTPVGSVTSDAVAPGVPANLALATPAGSVTSDAVASGVTANLALTSPAGSVASDADIIGVPANIAFTAPAGSVTISAIATGVTASISFTAPAGSVTVSRARQAGKLKITDLPIGKLTISDRQPKVVVTEVSGGRVTIS